MTNKPGACGAIGLAHVARAKPDGHTLGMSNMPGLVSLPPEVEQTLAGALRRIAANAECQAQMQAHFTEMDYLPAVEWRKRLDAAEAACRQMWASKPWNE